MKYAPIVLFAYNRKDLLEQTVNALKENHLADESRLFIFSDGPKNSKDKVRVDEVRQYIEAIDGFKEIDINYSENNKGLATSVITGVDSVIRKYGKVIVVEDDLITSKNFLRYINKSLDQYKNEKHIFSCTGYSYPPNRFTLPDDYPHDVFLGHRAHSWTWATWLDRWETIDWQVSGYVEMLMDDEKVAQFQRGGHDMADMLSRQMFGLLDSWAIRYCYAQYKYNGYTLYPSKSFTHNIGFGDNATHCLGSSKPYDVLLDNLWEPQELPMLHEADKRITEKFLSLFANRDIQFWRDKWQQEQLLPSNL